MARKTYRQYKEDKYVSLPLLAWLLDRSIIYIALGLIFVVGSGYWLFQGYQSVQAISEEPEVDSPYQSIEAVASPGMLWGSDFAQAAPPAVVNWGAQPSSRPKHIVDPATCPAVGELSPTLLATYEGRGEGVTMRAQIFGAGQAGAIFEDYAERLEGCLNSTVENRDAVNVISYPSGFIFNRGDAIIGVTGQPGSIGELWDYYRTTADATLLATNCLSLDVLTSDASRSLYYNTDAYKGLQEEAQVETTVDVSQLPVITGLETYEIANSRVQQPEGPLPADFQPLPAEVERPAATEAPAAQEFVRTVAYQISDEAGPGCGWEWTAQRAPQVDEAELEKLREELLASTQAEVDSAAAAHVTASLDWAFNEVGIALSIDGWNRYVEQVNAVHERWLWLTDQREQLRSTWFAYVERHELWSTFDTRQAAAQAEYDAQVEACIAQNESYDEWFEEYGEIANAQPRPESTPASVSPRAPSSTPTPTPSPSQTATPRPTPTPSPTPTIPPAPEQCLTAPAMPAILSAVKGEEPQAPAVPEGVTLPQSWPQP